MIKTFYKGNVPTPFWFFILELEYALNENKFSLENQETVNHLWQIDEIKLIYKNIVRILKDKIKDDGYVKYQTCSILYTLYVKNKDLKTYMDGVWTTDLFRSMML